MVDSVAGGATVLVGMEFIPARAIGENNPVRPGVGQFVLYFPSHNEFAGGYSPLPAIVLSSSVLAVIDTSANMTAKPMPFCKDTWIAAGSDSAFPHWEAVQA